MDDNSLVAKWKIAGVQKILQALQTTQLEDAVNEDVCFVLSGCLGGCIRAFGRYFLNFSIMYQQY
mgnify:FL=1